MNHFFNGFGDELVKLSGALSDVADLKGSALSATGAALDEYKVPTAIASGILGAGSGSLLGALAAGKGRRGRGGAVGALLGAVLSAGQGSRVGKNMMSTGKGLMDAAEKKASDRDVQDEMNKALKSSTGRNAATTGGLMAAVAAISGKKGQRLRRALAGAGVGGAIGGLAGLGGSSMAGNAMHDTASMVRSGKNWLEG